MQLARDSEVAFKGDSIDESPAVVPPAPVLPPPVSPEEVAAGAGFDYNKLASAILAAQQRQAETAAAQAAGAADAVAANPGFTPPGSVTAPAGDPGHAAADALS